VAVLSKDKQVAEIISCGKNSSHFINKYVKIQHPTRGLVSFDTYKFQDDCLDQFEQHRFNVILKSRQLGISTLAAAYALWLALFYKDKAILIIATKLAVAQNFIKKVKVMLQNLPTWLVMPTIRSDTKQVIEFSNGSSIKAIPTSEDAGRSEALTLLIVDEAAFIGNFDELWTGLYPTLSTGGRAIVLSTPNGVGGQYHKLYVEGESGLNEFNAIKLPWDVHPERDQAWFDNESKNMTRKQVAQELLCDFAASGDTFLNANDLEYIMSNTQTPIERWGPEMGVWVWRYYLPDHKYIIAADVARGDGADYSSFHVIDTTAGEQVCEFKGKVPPDQFAVLLNEVGLRYGKALVCPENNSYGYAVCMKLKELGYPNLYYKDKKYMYLGASAGSEDVANIGFTTGPSNRTKILTKLEEVIRNKQIRIRSTRMSEELKTFTWIGQTAKAMKGYNDDLVMALAIGIWLYDTNVDYSKHSQELSKAMLSAFSVNKRDHDDQPFVPHAKNPMSPIMMDAAPTKAVHGMNPYAHFGWLVRG
jgi:hypothetical protein